jgi:hypothetical protein
VSAFDRLLRPFRSAIGLFNTTRRTVAAVPDLVDAILWLPTVSRQLEEVKFSTATLPEMLEEIRRVHADTSALPAMEAEIARMSRAVTEVQRNTLAVEQLAEVALPLQGAAMRVGRFSDRFERRRALRPPREPR